MKLVVGERIAQALALGQPWLGRVSLGVVTPGLVTFSPAAALTAGLAVNLQLHPALAVPVVETLVEYIYDCGHEPVGLIRPVRLWVVAGVILLPELRPRPMLLVIGFLV